MSNILWFGLRRIQQSWRANLTCTRDGQDSPLCFVSFCPPISYRHSTLSSLLKTFTGCELTNFVGQTVYSLMLQTVYSLMLQTVYSLMLQTVHVYITLFHITTKKINFHKVPRYPAKHIEFKIAFNRPTWAKDCGTKEMRLSKDRVLSLTAHQTVCSSLLNCLKMYERDLELPKQQSYLNQAAGCTKCGAAPFAAERQFWNVCGWLLNVCLWRQKSEISNKNNLTAFLSTIIFNTREINALLAGSQASPACPSDKSNFKMKMIMNH
jgi:hypothetical protein